MKHSKTSFCLWATVFSFSVFNLNAQWIALPDPVSAYSTFTSPSSMCLNTEITPGLIQPLADGKIIYTSLCTSGSTHQGPSGYLMMSNDNLATGQIIKTSGEFSGLSAYNNNTEFAYHSYNQGTAYYGFSGNSWATGTVVAAMLAPGIATAITPNYIYYLGALSSAVVLRASKNGAVLTSTTVPGFHAVADKLKFINDSIGFTLAGFQSNFNKKTLVKISNYGLNWQPLLIDSVDHLIDYTISSGVMYVLKKSGAVYKTTDYGVTFSPLTPAPSGTYTCIRFATSSTGFMGGANGVLLKTTDGGVTWTNENSNTTQDIKSIYTYNYSSYFLDAANKVYISQQPTGILEAQNFVSFEMYPNPARKELTVKYTSNTGRPASLEIADLSGRRVYAQMMDATSLINVSGLSSGVYVLTISEDHQMRAIKKLVIED